MSERYVDPNSGAAQQPGGFAMAKVVTEEKSKAKEAEPATDPSYDAKVEHSAGPAGEQPGDPDGANASETGQTAETEGGGSEEDPSAGASAEAKGDSKSEEPEAEAEGSTEEPKQEETPAEEPKQEEGPKESEKDYSELLEKKLDEVQSYMDSNPDEVAAIQAAESEREKPRKGIVER